MFKVPKLDRKNLMEIIAGQNILSQKNTLFIVLPNVLAYVGGLMYKKVNMRKFFMMMTT